MYIIDISNVLKFYNIEWKVHNKFKILLSLGEENRIRVGMMAKEDLVYLSYVISSTNQQKKLTVNMT